MSLLLQLYISFFKIGMMAFGGGLASISLIQNEVVVQRGWATISEFADLVTIAEMTPGPIAINSATFVGQKMCGFLGGIVASLGCITPSCIIVSCLAFFYFKYRNLKIFQGVLAGLKPGIVGMILSAGITIFMLAIFGEGGLNLQNPDVNFISLIVIAASYIALRKFKVSPIAVIMTSGAIGAAIYFLGAIQR